MADSGKDLLKVLCIHGYRQNGKAFRERTGAFRKITKKYAELVFIDAPNVVPPLEGTSEENGGAVQCSDPRGWWFSRQDKYYNAHDFSQCCSGYEESLESIKQAFQQQGPFDGILGFSQGASMLSLICGLQQQAGVDSPFRFKFAIFVAGFKSRQGPHQSLYKEPITIPTLHVFGDSDRVIQKDMSEELLQHYIQPTILNHTGGHFIPASGQQKKVYVEFLEEMVKHKTLEKTPT